MSSDKLESFPIRFTGKNYCAWEFQFKLFVKGKELWGHIDGSNPAPRDAEALSKWEIKDARVMTWILSSVEPHLVLNPRPYKTAVAMWNYLHTVYNQDNSARRFQLEYEMVNFTRESLSIEEYFSGFQTLWTDYSDIVYANVPAAALSASNLMNRHPVPSLDACSSELLREEQRIHRGGIRVETCVLSSALVVKILVTLFGIVPRTRLVALGNKQEYGVDYEETFAPVAKMTTHKYIQDLITLAGLEETSFVDTPMEVNVEYRKDEGDLLDDPTLYRRLVGSSPTHGLFFPTSSSLQLVAYSDADWAGCPDTRLSTMGWCMFLGYALISWRCKKQDRVSKSSTEAEYRAMSTACSEIVWLHGLLEELGFPQTTSTPLHADNTSAIQIATNPLFHERTKHIEVDLSFYLRHLGKSGDISSSHLF
ncbi:hypothetical protein AAG906_028348 [Vitis piasezkii]